MDAIIIAVVGIAVYLAWRAFRVWNTCKHGSLWGDYLIYVEGMSKEDAMRTVTKMIQAKQLPQMTKEQVAQLLSARAKNR